MIKLTLPLPPSQNRLTRAAVNRKSGRVYKPGAKLRDEYYDWVQLAAVVANVYNVGVKGRLSLTIDWFYGAGARLDIDNGIKVCMDSLAAAIGFNDRDIVQLHVYLWPNLPEHPHCEIQLKELEYED